MTHGSPSLDRAQLEAALTAVLDRALPALSQFQWRLVGTGAALLHGVDLPVGDIDILVQERAAVDGFAAALAPFPCLMAPTWLEHSPQYYCNYDVHGSEVGVSTVEAQSYRDTSETLGPGPWQHCALLPCGAHSVPTVALELRLITELLRRRPDHYRPILDFMAEHGCDLALVSRGLEEIAAAVELRQLVLDALRGEPGR